MRVFTFLVDKHCCRFIDVPGKALTQVEHKAGELPFRVCYLLFVNRLSLPCCGIATFSRLHSCLAFAVLELDRAVMPQEYEGRN
jgi:hypothetical protein